MEEKLKIIKEWREELAQKLDEKQEKVLNYKNISKSKNIISNALGYKKQLNPKKEENETLCTEISEILGYLDSVIESAEMIMNQIYDYIIFEEKMHKNYIIPEEYYLLALDKCSKWEEILSNLIELKGNGNLINTKLYLEKLEQSKNSLPDFLNFSWLQHYLQDKSLYRDAKYFPIFPELMGSKDNGDKELYSYESYQIYEMFDNSAEILKYALLNNWEYDKYYNACYIWKLFEHAIYEAKGYLYKQDEIEELKLKNVPLSLMYRDIEFLKDFNEEELRFIKRSIFQNIKDNNLSPDKENAELENIMAVNLQLRKVSKK